MASPIGLQNTWLSQNIKEQLKTKKMGTMKPQGLSANSVWQVCVKSEFLLVDYYPV